MWHVGSFLPDTEHSGTVRGFEGPNRRTSIIREIRSLQLLILGILRLPQASLILHLPKRGYRIPDWWAIDTTQYYLLLSQHNVQPHAVIHCVKCKVEELFGAEIAFEINYFSSSSLASSAFERMTIIYYKNLFHAREGGWPSFQSVKVVIFY